MIYNSSPQHAPPDFHWFQWNTLHLTSLLSTLSNDHLISHYVNITSLFSKHKLNKNHMRINNDAPTRGTTEKQKTTHYVLGEALSSSCPQNKKTTHGRVRQPWAERRQVHNKPDQVTKRSNWEYHHSCNGTIQRQWPGGRWESMIAECHTDVCHWLRVWLPKPSREKTRDNKKIPKNSSLRGIDCTGRWHFSVA